MKNLNLIYRFGIIVVGVSLASFSPFEYQKQFDPVYERIASACFEITECTSAPTGFQCTYIPYDGYYRIPYSRNVCSIITLIAYQRV